MSETSRKLYLRIKCLGLNFQEDREKVSPFLMFIFQKRCLQSPHERLSYNAKLKKELIELLKDLHISQRDMESIYNFNFSKGRKRVL